VGKPPDDRLSALFFLGVLALGTLLFLPSCGDGGPTGLDTSDLVVLIVRGDGQASEPGALLPKPLQVRVQKGGNGAPVEGARVRWEVVVGGGAILDPPLSSTDSLGLAETRLRVGSQLGAYRVQASVGGSEPLGVEFSAEAILVPSLSAVPSDPVQSGDTILIQGTNFSLVPAQNLVTFSGIRGEVVSSSSGELRVAVPRCLVAREYEVRVAIGALSTEAATLQVQGNPSSLDLAPGEDLVLDSSDGFGCLHLPPGPENLYLVVPHSTGTVGGGKHEYSLLGLTGDGRVPAFSVPPPPGQKSAARPESGRPALGPERIRESALDARDRWHERLRLLEAQLWAEESSVGLAPVSKVPGPEGPVSQPEVGDKRVFKVLNAKNKFDKVTARLRHISTHSLVYVDEDSPAGGFGDQDLASLALEFEDPIYPTVTAVFGSESDLDQNGRVIILLTPAVNRLTEPGSGGYVGGFFYGLDLLAGRDGSNEAEVFYALVPDPSGDHGTVISRSTALAAIPAVLAHEFEHMVHFNQRMLLGGAETTEALWLSEALAQMAEDLIGEVFALSSQVTKANQYRAGNWFRAIRFLEDPGQVSVLASLSPGTLAERGAGWLLLKQVYGRLAPENLLGQVVRSTLSGTENISAASGLEWREIVGDWAGSLYLDGIGLPVRPDLQVEGVDLRTALSLSQGSYPLEVRSFGQQSTAISGTLWSSAPNYFIINPPHGSGIAISAGGPSGGLPEPGLGLQVLVVRLQ
jgi:hypothetical protein